MGTAFDENVKNESSVKFQLTSMKNELKWKLATRTAIVFIMQRMSVKVSFLRFTRSLSLSPVRCLYLYRTRRIPHKQHSQITVTHHKRSDSIVATNKHVTISTQTANFCRSVMHRHTCTHESRKLFPIATRNISTVMPLMISFYKSTDIGMLIHTDGGSGHGRIDYFIPYLVHRIDSGRWLFDGEHPTIESIFIQWKFHQALEPVN
jgi:hypothetical protein